MKHTYLRYECADSFGLAVSTASSKAPPSNALLQATPISSSGNHNNDELVWAVTGSSVTAYRKRTNLPVLRLAHREQLSGGVGTGRALNADAVTCFDVSHPAFWDLNSKKKEDSHPSSSSSSLQVATGWLDGAIRIFEVTSSDLHKACNPSSSSSSSEAFGLVHSLLHQSNDDGDSDGDQWVLREPLVLHGHSGSAIRTLAYDPCHPRLASGGNDGTVVVWDVLAETGLFRLRGHKGGITELRFASVGGTASSTSGSSQRLDGLITASLDGLVKVWDLQQQCCVQTLANHRGEVWGTACSNLQKGNQNDSEREESDRWRLVTGGSDGQLRLWAVEAPQQTATTAPSQALTRPSEHPEAMDLVPVDPSQPLTLSSSAPHDQVCRYMGIVPPPPNVVTSTQKIVCVRFHQHLFMGVLRSDSKSVEVYRIKSTIESRKKRQRRLKRRKEKQTKQSNSAATRAESGIPPVGKSGQKRGILDDPESSDDDDRDDPDVHGPAEDRALDPEAIKASDEFEYLASISASHKVRSFGFAPHRESGQLVRVVCALATNALETFALVRDKTRYGRHKTIIFLRLFWSYRARQSPSRSNPVRGVLAFFRCRSPKNPRAVVAEKLPTLDVAGHPTGIRAVALSSDDSIACTVSKNITKIWNVHSRTCIHSLAPVLPFDKKASTYGLCAVFLPGNSHVVVGTREGHLLIIDIAAGEVVFAEAKAHKGAIWSIDLRRPNGSEASVALVTGSADHSVKFWIVESDDDDEDDLPTVKAAQRPVLVHTRTLELKDDVVAVRYSHTTEASKRFVFVSALDNTIKVFFDDSLKLFLNLYGHSLPALAMDASDDDTILASGSADKTVKIWGLDFGDTHRTLHGHDDSITDLRFVRRTHNFFTSSKDGTVRYWDGDRFEQILMLNGHSAEVNCLAVSRTGAFVLSGGMDRQIRVWERTKDIVFLQEERERALEQIFDRVNGRDAAGTASILDRKDDDSEQEGPNDDQPQSEAAVQRTVLSVAAGDRILEGLERADQELKDILIWNKANGPDKKKQLNPMLLNMEPAHYVLWLLKSIKSAELESSLLVLPLTHIERLVYYCTVLLKQGRGIELCAKVSVFLVRVHQNQVRL